MAKRLVDTEVWKKQRWFRKLSPIYKLAFLYIKDQCDHAGLWNISVLDLIDDLGIELFDVEDFVLKCNLDFDKKTGVQNHRERLVTLPNGYIWITSFCQFQYAGKDNKIHAANASFSAIQKLHGLDLIDLAVKNKYLTLANPLDSFLRSKDKDKDKDKDNLNNTQNHNNGKSIRNFKAQGEDLYAQRASRNI